jgi:uncharacterized membrane protein (DUF373 family)
MIVLVALELEHSIISVVAERRGMIQVRTVLLIALLAISRKVIILNAEISAGHIVAVASVAVAFGATYWTHNERRPQTHDAVGQSFPPNTNGVKQWTSYC